MKPPIAAIIINAPPNFPFVLTNTAPTIPNTENNIATIPSPPNSC